jgi:hypothetical protein
MGLSPPKPQERYSWCMSKMPRDIKPGKKPASPITTKRFISFESHMHIIKRGARTFVIEFVKTISEIRTTNNNVVELPSKAGPRATINLSAVEDNIQDI